MMRSFALSSSLDKPQIVLMMMIMMTMKMH